MATDPEQAARRTGGSHRRGPRHRQLLAATLCVALAVGACTSGTSTRSADRGSTGVQATATAAPPSAPAPGGPGAVIVATPTPEGPRPLVIATVLGETGVLAPLDGTALAGIVAEVQRLNDEGGVLGREVRVERYDTNSRHSVAERITERLLEDPPDLIVTSCDIEFARPVLELADQAERITISPCAGDVGYLTGGYGSRNFSMGAPADVTGEIAARNAFERYGPTAMVLLDVTNPEAAEFCRGFERQFAELGGTVLYRDEFSYDTLEPIQDRLAESGAQTGFITLCSHVPGGLDAAPAVISMLRTLGFGAPVVAGSSVDEPGWIPLVPLLDEMTFVSWASNYGNDPDDRVNDIVRRASQNGDTPGAGVATALGADTVQAWARAVEAARDTDQAKVAAALGSFVDEPFITGDITFAGGARMDTGRLYRILDVREGKLSVFGIEEIPD